MGAIVRSSTHRGQINRLIRSNSNTDRAETSCYLYIQHDIEVRIWGKDLPMSNAKARAEHKVGQDKEET